MSPRRSLLAVLISAALVVSASPAMAMTPKAVTPGWSPSDPPANPGALAVQLTAVTYAVSCGGVTATGWSADVADESDKGIRGLLVTTSAVVAACFSTPGSLVARQGEKPIDVEPYVSSEAIGVGSIVSPQDLPYIDWDYVPMPRVGQWVGIAGRAADGSALPILEGRVTSVGTDTFTLDAPVTASYLGAPVVDNQGRALGSVTSAGDVVTGAPQFCDVIFICTDAGKVWWDITAPSAVTNARKVSGKGSVTVTWQAAADDGGDEVAYWYRVDTGPWTQTETFRVKVKARKGQRVVVSIGTINAAGPGPTVTVSAKAK